MSNPRNNLERFMIEGGLLQLRHAVLGSQASDDNVDFTGDETVGQPVGGCFVDVNVHVRALLFQQRYRLG